MLVGSLRYLVVAVVQTTSMALRSDAGDVEGTPRPVPTMEEIATVSTFGYGFTSSILR